MFSFFPWMLCNLKLQLSWLKHPPPKKWRGGKYNIPAGVYSYLQNSSSYSSWLLDWKCENFRSQKLFFSTIQNTTMNNSFWSCKPLQILKLYQVGALSLVSDTTDKRFIFYECLLVTVYFSKPEKNTFKMLTFHCICLFWLLKSAIYGCWFLKYLRSTDLILPVNFKSAQKLGSCLLHYL